MARTEKKTTRWYFQWSDCWLWQQLYFMCPTCASTAESRTKRSRRIFPITATTIMESGSLRRGRALRGFLDRSPPRESPTSPSCTACASDHGQVPDGVTGSCNFHENRAHMQYIHSESSSSSCHAGRVNMVWANTSLWKLLHWFFILLSCFKEQQDVTYFWSE